MAAEGSLRRLLSGRRQRPIRLALSVLGRQLARVYEVLELLLVLVSVAVGRIAKDATLLDEVLERGARVSRGTEAKLAGGLGHGQRAAPAEEVKELRREKCHPGLSNGESRQLEPDWREQRRVQLACGVEQLGQRLWPWRGDVVSAGGPSLGRQRHRLDAVVAVDQLERRVVAGHGRDHLEVQVAGERLRLVRVQAVGKAQHEGADVGV